MKRVVISYKGYVIGEIHSDGLTAFCNCYNKVITYTNVSRFIVPPVLDGRFDNIGKSGVHEDGSVEVFRQDEVGLVIEVTVDAEDVSPLYVTCYRDGEIEVRYAAIRDVSRLRARVEDVSEEV